jgi:hypothetical protein
MSRHQLSHAQAGTRLRKQAHRCACPAPDLVWNGRKFWRLRKHGSFGPKLTYWWSEVGPLADDADADVFDVRNLWGYGPERLENLRGAANMDAELDHICAMICLHADMGTDFVAACSEAEFYSFPQPARNDIDHDVPF